MTYAKLEHEIRDPIYGFIKFSKLEREIINSEPMQRLRDINQLALTFLIYPSATHKRFEHSLGVMELATRVFDVITSQENMHPTIENNDELREFFHSEKKKLYWKSVLRVAALCHDIGHLPFSHAAEKELLPDGISHETMGIKIIESKLKEIIEKETPPLRVEDVIKLAMGQEKLPDKKFTALESLLSEIITGNVFGADRMDYLVRDSHHLGVAYGHIDQHRLINTLRILIDENNDNRPMLGIESGGINVAESLLISRYLMFSQVYYHHVRIAYNEHLKDFLIEYLEEKEGKPQFPTDVDNYLNYTDSLILSEIYKRTKNKELVGHEKAKRIANREHYKKIYKKNLADISETCLNPVRCIYDYLSDIFGTENVKIFEKADTGGILDFLIVNTKDEIKNSTNYSELVKKMPTINVGYVLINKKYRDEAEKLLENEKEKILKEKK